MKVSYKKLRKLLIDKDYKKKALNCNVGDIMEFVNASETEVENNG